MSNLITQAKKVLFDIQGSPRKKFGQHFMIDETVIQTIVEAVRPKKGQWLIEIGPGLGFLTRRLMYAGARVYAIEKDPLYVQWLQKQFPSQSFRVLHADILNLNLPGDLGLDQAVKLVGNIPYNITAPILDWVIRHRHFLNEAVLTTQWEVAQRITADPGNKLWGALSIFVQVYSEVSIIKKVSPACFWPRPKVESAVLQMGLKIKPKHGIISEVIFFDLVQRAFQKRRKNILNSLADETRQLFKKQALMKTLSDLNLDWRRRPETFSIQEWALFSNSLSHLKD